MDILGSAIETGGAIAMNQGNKDWAEKMSSTQYQRAVEDMRAAGINPVMAAGTGGAGFSNPSTANPTSGLAQNLNSAKRLSDVEKPIADAEVQQKKANTDVTKEVKERTKAETQLTKTNNRVQQANAKVTEAAVPRAQVESKPWEYGGKVISDLEDEARKEREPTKDKVARWKREDAKKVSNAGDTYASGKGTVHGGRSSAKQSMEHIPTGKGSIQ